jgi:ABC-type antimicrobial peptide transport system ATPase subunit
VRPGPRIASAASSTERPCRRAAQRSAGKTTTVSILTTTLAPTSGRVPIAGRDLATEQAAVRRQIGRPVS